MAIQWTGLGPELLLRLDRGSGRSLRSQLEAALREAIQSARLGVGEPLPSTRRLASELGIARGLVVECYAQLAAEGYVTTRVGSRTRIAAGGVGVPTPPRVIPEVVPLSIDFKPFEPDLTSFPRRDWIWALSEVCRSAPADELGYGEPNGSEKLREVLAAYLRRVRGVVANPDLIVICAGATQGLALVLRALAAEGIRRIGVEDPGPFNLDIFGASADLMAVPVPVDKRGIDVSALAAVDSRAVLVTPAHQAPSGVVMGPERRQALVAWAKHRDGLIIEDDYDAEFRYDSEPVGAVQGLAPDKVALLGTVSKSLAPALRLGWVVCPPHLARAVADAKGHDDRRTPALDQLALAALLESGRFDRHLRRMRKAYSARRDALVSSLYAHAPGVHVTGLAAGLHAVAHLPKHLEEERVISQARLRSIGLRGMSRHRFDNATTPPQLVLGFGTLSEASIERGIAAIADLLR